MIMRNVECEMWNFFLAEDPKDPKDLKVLTK